MLLKKEDDTKNPANCRPISITSCLARLFERVILERLNAYLGGKRILINQQSGFRKKRQTKDNLAFLTQKVAEAFKFKKSVVALPPYPI